MKAKLLTGVLIGWIAASCGSVQDVQVRAAHSAATDDDDADDVDEAGENDVEVPLDQVPAAVREAALAAVPGLVLVSAEKETEEGSLHYCLEGRADGEAVEVEVEAAGARVVEIERGDDD